MSSEDIRPSLKDIFDKHRMSRPYLLTNPKYHEARTSLVQQAFQAKVSDGGEDALLLGLVQNESIKPLIEQAQLNIAQRASDTVRIAFLEAYDNDDIAESALLKMAEIGDHDVKWAIALKYADDMSDALREMLGHGLGLTVAEGNALREDLGLPERSVG